MKGSETLSREWLNAIREKHRMTQENVAEKSGISRVYYTRIENGDYNVPVDTAKKIAEALGFDWTKFYEEETT